VANGDASDWMLNEMDIMAFTMEISSNHGYSKTRIPDKKYIYQIVDGFYGPI